MKTWTKLNTEEEYQEAEKRLDELLTDEEIDEDNEELIQLSNIIEEYETEHYPIKITLWDNVLIFFYRLSRFFSKFYKIFLLKRSKPIFMIGIPIDTISGEEFIKIKESLNSQLYDYHVLVYINISNDISCKVFYFKDIYGEKIKEIKEFVESEINKIIK